MNPFMIKKSQKRKSWLCGNKNYMFKFIAEKLFTLKSFYIKSPTKSSTLEII